MKKLSKQDVKNIIATGSSFLLGEIHFLAQSTADITAHTEGKIVNKLTGKPVNHIKEDRYIKTYEKQEQIKAAGKAIFDKLKSTDMRGHAVTDNEIINETLA